MTDIEVSASRAGQIQIGDLVVNRLGFGAMRITGPGIWGQPENIALSMELLKKAVGLGVNFIDTADAYGPEVSENLIYEALFPYKGMVIATKGGLTRSGPGQWIPDCSPAHLRKACEDSLVRLNLDKIDLYQLHTVDPNVPFEESFSTLLELQREGKIRHIGLSNIEPEHFRIAINMGQFVTVQNHYNLLNREHEDVLNLCERHGIAFIPYFPVGGNDSSGLNNKIIDNIAKEHKVSSYQIALAWLLNHSSNILPIPGTSSIDHLLDNIASVNIKLSIDQIEQLDQIGA